MKEHKEKFDSKQIIRIADLINNEKYKFALEELERYMQAYPKDDENSLFQYGNIMLKLGNIEEAEETFKYIEKIATKPFAKFWAPYKLGEIYESKFKYDITRQYFEQAYQYHTKWNINNINFGFARLAIREGKLDLADKYLKDTNTKELSLDYKFYLARLRFLQGNIKEANDIMKTLTLEELEKNKNSTFLISMISNLKNHLKFNTISYHDQQLINYDKNKALKHIIERHVITGDFDNNIDIKKIFNKIDSLIDFDLKESNALSDYYFIDHPNEANKKIKVVCLPNTKKVLSMYPYDETIIEEEYTGENTEENIVKTKQLTPKSQIDKFNSRYKI